MKAWIEFYQLEQSNCWQKGFSFLKGASGSMVTHSGQSGGGFFDLIPSIKHLGCFSFTD